MFLEHFEIVGSLPELDEYMTLYRSAGWDFSSPDAMMKGINGSLYSILVRSGSNTVGMGRIIGDGGRFFIMVDILVLPEYQNKGIGSAIVSKLVDWVKDNAPGNSRLWLLAAEGRESFYERFGFVRRPAPGMGAGMQLLLDSR